jgi:hypothetical protein
MDGENRVSIALNNEIVQRLRDAVKVLTDNMQPFLVKISAQERRELAKMGDKTVSFVTKSAEYAEMNPQLVPPFVDVAEMRKDVNTIGLLRPIASELEKLTDQLSDTMMLAGSEAYSSALAFYGSAKNAAKLNQPNAEVIANELKVRFSKSSVPSQPEGPAAS